MLIGAKNSAGGFLFFYRPHSPKKKSLADLLKRYEVQIIDHGREQFWNFNEL